MTRRARAAIVVLALVFSWVLASGPPAASAAAPIVVTTTTPDVPGSIQQAFVAANTNPGSDTIVLQTNAAYLLNCDTGSLTNSAGALEIDGNDATIEQSCGDQRVIAQTASEPLTVGSLRIDHGGYPASVSGCGGSVYASGPLVVNQVVVVGGRSDANGGALCSDASITMQGGGVSGGSAAGDGGALFAPTIEIDGAHLRVSSAQRGGGAWANTLHVDHAVAEANLAPEGAAFGGQDVSIRNSTVLSNVGTRGLAAFVLGQGLVEHSTVTGHNGSSFVAGGGVVSLGANILQPNASFICEAGGGSFTSTGYNVATETTTCPLAGPGDVVSNLQAQLQPVAWVDPAPVIPIGLELLDSDKFASGKVRVRKPFRDSSIINTIPVGHPFCSGLDQRGFVRPVGAGCEPGAVEARNEGSVFVPVDPARILDTRTFMVPTGHAAGAPLPGGETMQTRVAGIASIPADATAVVVNLTSTEATSAGGYLTAWPSGTARPLVSTVNMQPGANVPNQVTVKVGASGHVNLFTNVGATHVVMDVFGYYRDQPDGGDGFESVSQRILDTRTDNVPPGWPKKARLEAGAILQLPVSGASTVVPSNATAVVMNITSTEAKSDLAYVTAWPNGSMQPATSNLNLQSAFNVATLVTVKVGVGGRVNLSTNTSSTHLVVDLLGYYGPSTVATYVPLVPTRILDSRNGPAFGPGTSRYVQVMDSEDVRERTSYVVANLTATQTSSKNGYASVEGAGSTLNYRPGTNVANAFVVHLFGGGFRLHNSAGTTHLIVDMVGIFET